MSDKIERYKKICVDMHDLSTFLQMPQEDKAAEIEATLLIRELRQAIERLRRIVDDEQPPVEVHSLQDAMKLHKDELAFVAWQFFQWGRGEDCPVNVCHDFQCRYRQKAKENCLENLKRGDLDEADYKQYEECGFYANSDCDDTGEGCWASYYVWCYLNGYNPLEGKKDAK